MLDRYVIPAVKALLIAIPLWLMLIFAIGKLTWGLAGIGLVIFAVLWLLMRGTPPRRYDTPPSPDEWWRRWWDN